MASPFRCFLVSRRRTPIAPLAPTRMRAATPRAVESLEERRLFAAGPQVIGQQLIGSASAVTSVKLFFNMPLDVTSAQDTANYLIRHKVDKGKDDGGFFDSFDPFSLPGGDSGNGRKNGVNRVKFSLATYDAATMSVTLTPKHPFGTGTFFREILVQGKGQHFVRAVDGTPLDGLGNGKPGHDAPIKFKRHKSDKLSVKETDGDKYTIKFSGPGRMLSFTRKKANASPIIFLINANPATSMLTATVKQGKHGDGIIDIEELSGVGTANVTFLNDPNIVIGLTQQ